MRRLIIAGNWKMNLTLDESTDLVREICKRVGHIENVDMVVCPPFPLLSGVAEVLKGTAIGLGGQNMHWEPKGPYTGEISARMLLTAGCRYVILGHSERRLHFGETDEMVKKKVAAALAAGLIPILCIGERLEEREIGKTEEIVEQQLSAAVQGLSREEVQRIVIAYEPVWAIGTGKSATPEMANDVHLQVRALLGSLYGEDTAARVRIQYGGSVNEENAAALLSQPDIDGALIGGASLKAEVFSTIIRIGSESTGG